MKIVSFKNGDKIKVEDFIANEINKKILSPQGAKTWQTFVKGETEECILMINLTEVNFIASKENIT